MDTSDDKLRSISSQVSRTLSIFCEKSSAHASVLKNVCVAKDCVDSHKWKLTIITGGSRAEGTTTTTSDFDVMLVEPTIVATQNRRETLEGDSNILIIKSHSNPGYTRLQYLEVERPFVMTQRIEESFDATPDGIFLSSEKFMRSMLDYISTSTEPIRRHGPCTSKVMHNYVDYVSGKDPTQRVYKDVAQAFACNSWPDETMEWFTRDRRYGWPSKNLVKKIRKEKCHVVPVGDPTSTHPSLEWRFSFLLAERQLIWSFNDTQIQCYYVLKLLIQKYINPTVPDEVSSYHLKTIVFWQSESLGISAWSEDELLHRVRDCLSYLSQCVQDGRLEHYFFRGNNLMKHKLKKSDDRKFLLDTIKSIENNLIENVFEIIPGCGLFSNTYSKYGTSIDGPILVLLKNTTHRDYVHLQNVIVMFYEYRAGIFEVFSSVTRSLKGMDSFEWAFRTFEERPPADVDKKFVKIILMCISIKLAIQHYRESMDISVSEEKRKSLTNKSLLLMERGAKIDDLVGNLYLATLHYRLKNYSKCEHLILQPLYKRWEFLYEGGSKTPCFMEACEPDLKFVHKHFPDLVKEMVEKTFLLVFSEEDIDIVPYPLKFEFVNLRKVPFQFFTLHPFVYAVTLLYMAYFIKKVTQGAKQWLDILAKVVHEHRDSLESHRSYNLLGYCYSLDGQRDKAVSCYINSLTKTRTTQVGNDNAALYHLAILCFEVYTETRSD